MVAQFAGGHLLDERIRLLGGEPRSAIRISAIFPRCSQLAQGQRRSGPGDQYDLDGGREAEQQELKLIRAAAFPDEVVVVKNDDHRRRERGQLVDQTRKRIADRRHRPVRRTQNRVRAEVRIDMLH